MCTVYDVLYYICDTVIILYKYCTVNYKEVSRIQSVKVLKKSMKQLYNFSQRKL